MLLVFSAGVYAQAGRDETLANSYLQNGEYDKAAELYQSLWEKSSYDLKYYRPLYTCLLQLKKYDELEKVVKKELKKNDNAPQFVIDMGYMYAQVPNPDKAKEQYDKVLKELKPYETSIRELANIFEAYRLYDYVLAVYDKGGKLIRNETYFSFEMAQASLKKSDLSGAVKYLLVNLEANPGNMQSIKNTVQSSRDEEKLLAELETQLYAKVQKNANNEDYIDLLTWVYIQNKDFEGALAQMKALDRRKNETGMRVLNIARMAQTEGDYTSAIAGYEYVVAKGKFSALYFQSRTELLNCRKEKISKNINYTQADLEGLKGDYLAFIEENERGFRTAQSMKELADLEGFYRAAKKRFDDSAEFADRAEKVCPRGTLRRVIKRAFRTAVRVLPAADVSKFARGDSIRLEGQKLDLIVERSGSLAGIGAHQLDITLAERGGKRLADLCLYIDNTPALDQLTGLALAMAAGDEHDLVRDANVIRVYPAGENHPLLMGRKRAQVAATRATDPATRIKDSYIERTTPRWARELVRFAGAERLEIAA